LELLGWLGWLELLGWLERWMGLLYLRSIEVIFGYWYLFIVHGWSQLDARIGVSIQALLPFHIFTNDKGILHTIVTELHEKRILLENRFTALLLGCAHLARQFAARRLVTCLFLFLAQTRLPFIPLLVELVLHIPEFVLAWELLACLITGFLARLASLLYALLLLATLLEDRDLFDGPFHILNARLLRLFLPLTCINLGRLILAALIVRRC
jgi:hypothetical protein